MWTEMDPLTGIPIAQDGGWVLLNAFCPTGKGNGQDNSCSPTGSKAIGSVDFASNDAARQLGNLLGEKGRQIASRIEQAESTQEKINRLGDVDTNFLDDVYNKAPGTVEGNEYFRTLGRIYKDYEASEATKFVGESRQRLGSRVDGLLNQTEKLVKDLEKAGEDDLAYFYGEVGTEVMKAIKGEILQKTGR